MSHDIPNDKGIRLKDRTQNRLIFIVTGTPILLFVIIFFVPITGGVTKYLPASDILEGFPYGSSASYKYHPEIGANPGQEYAIYADVLYLKFQVLGRSLIIQFVDEVHWTEEKIAEFRKMHPELETYWEL